ncbi:ATP-binding protein [Streptomyces sp. 7N604]|uniref:ATP-binding protein n=1 Tax=Streptomyces sp. 7N604 TaxID=3457415 RepID=UPI003FD37947
MHRHLVAQRHGVAVAFERADQVEGMPLSERDARRVGEMRRIALAWLRYWDFTELIDSARLLISELVTKALQHGHGNEIGFSIAFCDGLVRVEVVDGSPGTPVVRSVGPQEENGHGMHLISALAEDWGTSEDGTHTWCVLRPHEGTDVAAPRESSSCKSPPRLRT